MQEFDCLAPETPISGKIFVEASAGTGKTFAIEHIVARLILEGYPIDTILITTFTKAGVRDLKQRIYQNLVKGEAPYLEKTANSTLLIKNALRLIDEAQIYTIHSFCHRMLSEFSFEAKIDVSLIDPDKGFRKETTELAILDTLRTLIDSTEFSPAQLMRLMAPFQRETAKFVKRMVSYLSTNPVIPEYSDYETLANKFIPSTEDLRSLAPKYNKTCNRAKQIHPFVEKQIEAVEKGDFETLIKTTPSIFELFNDDTSSTIASLRPIIREASDPFILFQRVAKKVQELLKTRKDGPNILLETMVEALSIETFKKRVNQKFRAIIIDEFQDTDPLQWAIFSSFQTELLMVVGDPKQSIYAFRGADLNTFLRAKNSFPSLYKLSANYRSDPELIKSLNTLFEAFSTQEPNFSYTPLTAKKEPSELSEEKCQFVVSEESNLFFSYIGHEILRLPRELSFAVLVKDRYQAFDITTYLQNIGLSVATTATANITEGAAFKFLKLRIKLTKNMKNFSLIKEFLAHPFIGWPLEKLRSEDDDFMNILPNLANHPPHIEDPDDYADFMQLMSLLLQQEESTWESYLEEISLFDENDHPELKRKPLIEKDSIHVMTTHMSKGLEFDIVFALGTALDLPEQNLESLRLFYVAATRAKEKLYIFVNPKERTSPVNLLLSKVPLPAHITLTAETPVIPIPPKERVIAEESSFSRFPPSKHYTSFSSQVTSHASPITTESDLPPGPHTGNLFHLLLEKMIETGAYYTWDETKIKTFIEKELKKTHLEGLDSLVYDILHAAFFTPLDGFCLNDVPPQYLLQEHPFCYTLDSTTYMKGFIDLAFLHNNHLYILDWKLNLLPSYTPETLHTAMQEHSYYTQAAIYKEALTRALPHHPFGNTFYFFLRGKENGLLTI